MPFTQYRTVDIVARDWANRVVAASGSVDSRTIAVVSQFVKGCRSDGIWSAMASGVILPFATDGFTGLFVPLVAPSGASFTNNGFASGDYSLSAGLDPGSGNSSKHLTSNFLSSSIITNSNYSGSVYQRVVRAQSGKTSVLISIEEPGTVDAIARFAMLISETLSRTDFFNDTTGTTTSSDITAGFFSGSYSSGTGRMFRNGTQLASATLSRTLSLNTTLKLFGFYTSTDVFLGSLCDQNVTSYCYVGPSVDEAAHYTRVQALQTALGRQV